MTPETRREAILDGARGALLRGGVEGMSMDSVAAFAGVAKGTLYLYYPSKAELVAALRLEYTRQLVDTAGSLLESAAPPEPAADRLERFAASMFEFIVDHRELHHQLFHGAGSEAEQFGPVVDVVARFLESAMDRGELRRGDPRLLASVTVAGVHAAMLPALHTANPDVATFASLMQDLVARLFR